MIRNTLACSAYWLLIPLMMVGSNTVQAVSHATNIASETTQLLNLAELVDQTQRMIKALKKAKQQLEIIRQNADLNDQDWAATVGILREVEGIYNNAQAIAYVAKVVNGRAVSRYPGYQEFEWDGVSVQELHRFYREWKRRSEDLIVSHVRATGAWQKDATRDAYVIDQIASEGVSADGRNKILQAGIKATSMIGVQMVKLRKQLIMNARVEQAWAMKKEEERYAKEEATRAVLKGNDRNEKPKSF